VVVNLTYPIGGKAKKLSLSAMIIAYGQQQTSFTGRVKNAEMPFILSTGYHILYPLQEKFHHRPMDLP